MSLSLPYLVAWPVASLVGCLFGVVWSWRRISNSFRAADRVRAFQALVFMAMVVSGAGSTLLRLRGS